MNPKPLRRSIIFWSGILVMLFIAWAWADSRKFVTGISLGSPAAFHGHSGIMIRRTHETIASVWRAPCANYYDDPVIPELFPLPFSFITPPDAIDRKVEIHRELPGYRRDGALPLQVVAEYWAPEGIPNNRTIFIPHWLLLLAVALSWSGLLLWRARRNRRVSKSIPPS